MEKSLIEKLKDAKRDYEIVSVNFYNNGTVNKDEYYMARKADEIGKWEYVLALETLEKATSSYARNVNFDSINMEMVMGLIFDINDVDENNKIKDNSEPKKDVVRYYTGRINSFLNGEKTNVADYFEYGINRQGFFNYNEFVKFVKKSGLSFSGPESFEEFKKRILAGEIFDIKVGAHLIDEQKNSNPLVRKLK